jgi:outer membrane protein OmpA-like peptidoglycan-associated protein
MKRFFILAVASFALLLFAADSRAQNDDAEGCKDSPLVSRFPGSSIHYCETKEFDQAEMPISKEATKTIEGAFQSWGYGTREGLSEIQVFRNFDTALRAAGFTIDFENSPSIITAHKGGTWYTIDNKGTYYDQTIVTISQMRQEVTADASSLADEINKSGHVAVYGIHFDTGKATLQPDSEQVLGEIVKLLDQNAALKLRVEGHTDNQGAAPANMTLSERRAQTVVAWLQGHGVAAARLTAVGLGQTKPVADNQTEDGRAKNRRVELAKQ